MTSVNACFRFLQSRVRTKAEIKNRWHLPKCASCTVARTGCYTHSFKEPSQVPGVAVVMNSEQTSTAHELFPVSTPYGAQKVHILNNCGGDAGCAVWKPVLFKLGSVPKEGTDMALRTVYCVWKNVFQKSWLHSKSLNIFVFVCWAAAGGTVVSLGTVTVLYPHSFCIYFCADL